MDLLPSNNKESFSQIDHFFFSFLLFGSGSTLKIENCIFLNQLNRNKEIVRLVDI